MSYHSRNAITYARPRRRNDISASTSSAVTGAAIGDGIYLAYVFNSLGALAYVRPVETSGGSVSASNGFPIADGTGAYLQVRPGEYIAGILASGSGTLIVCEMTV